MPLLCDCTSEQACPAPAPASPLISVLGRAGWKSAQVGRLWLPESAPGSVVRGDSFLGRGKGKRGEFLKAPQANFPTCTRLREGLRMRGIRAETEKAFS